MMIFITIFLEYLHLRQTICVLICNNNTTEDINMNFTNKHLIHKISNRPACPYYINHFDYFCQNG